ncbi:hypothetical protein QCA50_016901 [Cerrena zonata]|uniref:Cytochrome P450 n=1 Tax=Cerrena zonata TaxID=2478898 RepID=A0AAW0FLS3_9APHY
MILILSLPWHSGIPHNTLKSDIYDGYHIPENAMVVANIWAMSQDEDIYPNPTDFNPERYMDHAEEDPKNIVFGFGRRQCPGNELADRSIFILVTSIAATMNITKVKDTSGAEITPSLDFTSGFVSRPEAFSCEITARSDKAVRLIRQMKVATE